MKDEHHYISFFTATALKWKPLFKPDKYKKLIYDSMVFLVGQSRIKLYAYVIMPNHIHLLWKMRPPHRLEDVQRDFLRYTAQRIKQDLTQHHPRVLEHFYVGLKDRTYQFWQRNARSVFLPSREIVEQKLDYIHHNPVQKKWMLADGPDEYPFSSWDFYYEENKNGVLSHYMEEYGGGDG